MIQQPETAASAAASVDVIVLGAGPAGATAGLVLAPHMRVALIDRVSEPSPRIGESLIPAARRLLGDLKLLDGFIADKHPEYLGNRSSWDGETQETDFLRDPDGPGWHLDRPKFERFLRQQAVARGVSILAPAKVDSISRVDGTWHVELAESPSASRLTCRLIIDATGRTAAIARRLGSKRCNPDRLVARWLYGNVACETATTAGFSHVVSEPDGWWYTAPLADGRRVLAFHTDADLLNRLSLKTSQDMISRANLRPELATLLQEVGFQPVPNTLPQTVAANTGQSDPLIGDGWLTVGDAALAFDPLASRGVFNALYTGLAGAYAGHRMLSGVSDAAKIYRDEIQRIRQAYDQHLRLCYSTETRWSDHPFWARRRLFSTASADSYLA